MLPSSVSTTSTTYSFLSSRRGCLPRLASIHNFSSKPPHRFYHPQRLVSSRRCFTGFRTVMGAAAGSKKDLLKEEDVTGLELLDVGYISSTHGLKGELRVKPDTHFPELRFCKPGRRWLRARVLGKETISEMQLIGGRNHPGQKCWIISFEGIDTVEKAKQIVGSTLLVSERDRPELHEGEFYTHDLVGMRVIHKETSILVGTVTNVVNSGANDLLHVMRASCGTRKDILNQSDSPLSEKEIYATGQFVWIPFVEAIVPEVDMVKREMIITPPKGLLELNLRNDMRSKKERRHMEWKQRKKLQQQISASKKMLHEMGQSHLLVGFGIGEKGQKDKLAKQIVNANLRLFQHAMRSINMPSMRLSLFDFVGANSDILLKNTLKLPYEYFLDFACSEKNDWLKAGLQLLEKSKAAIILAINNDICLGVVSDEIVYHKLQKILLDYRQLLKFEEKSIDTPLILLASIDKIKSCEQLLLDNDYFGFNAEKVLFIEETRLPIVKKSAGSNKILLKSPWEILQASTGSGGIFASLSSQKGVDFLREMGVEYVQVCSLSDASAFGSCSLFGWASSRVADITLKMIENGMREDAYDMIFSMTQLSKLCKETEALSFQAVPEQYEHVELVDGEWVEVIPGSPNSYRLHCSIFDALNSCRIEQISIVQVMD